MEKFKRIAVKVTFDVVLIDIEISKDAKDQIFDSMDFLGIIKDESKTRPDALEWLKSNIKECDSLGHKYEIIQVD